MDRYGYRNDELKLGTSSQKSRSAREEDELERIMRPKEKSPRLSAGDAGIACDGIDPKDIVLKIVQRCPHDREHECCPIDEIRVWRNMDPDEAYSTISMLPDEVLRKLAERHCECSSEQKRKEDK